MPEQQQTSTIEENGEPTKKRGKPVSRKKRYYAAGL